MIELGFLAQWALRSSALILAGGLLLFISRVKSPSVRLAAWTVVLCGSLAIPLIGTALPELPLSVPATIPIVELHSAHVSAAPAPTPIRSPAGAEIPRSLDWARVAASLYLLVALLLLLRLVAGSSLAYRLRRGGRDTGLSIDGIRILESERVASPVTLGLLRPAAVLPVDWVQWDSRKLAAVLAHERSHVLRRDPAVQLLSAVHRALLWFSPLSWQLHRRIVQLAEEASDDAVIAVTRDRASYAELLLDFMRRGVRRFGLQAIAMARYGKPEKRINRILEGKSIPCGVSRWGVAVMLLIGLPAVLVASAVWPRLVQQAQSGQSVAAQQTPVSASPTAQAANAAPASVIPQAAPASASSAAQGGTPSQSPEIKRYIIRMGDDLSGSWDSRDAVDEEALHRRFGNRYAWFRQGLKEYVITDSGVLAEFENAMEPQKKVNKLQADVNDLQAKVNERQSGVNAPQQTVNALQQQVNAAQQEVNRRQDLVNKIQRSVQEGVNEELISNLEEALRELRAGKPDVSQEEINRLQAKVNKAQEEVNQGQARVNVEQSKVNKEQERVNEEQRRVSAEVNRRIREIFENALRRGLAQPWR
jgi:beta-lactamase regulating signal transducer with metallopeptidase domain/outer membrane murein-binding lipoprotein Lpp